MLGKLRETVTVAEALERQRHGALIVDVRDDDEFAEAHVAAALHLPLPDIESRMSEIPKDRDVLLFCRSGRRSGKAQDLLIDTHDYRSVYNIEGGIIAWAEADLPLQHSQL